MRPAPRSPLLPVLALALALGPGLAACGRGAAADDVAPLRLGYLTNVTHATPLVGVHEGLFAGGSGGGVPLETRAFNAGPDIVTALLGGALDAAYLGPNPAINAYEKTGGEGIRIVAGAASGGAFFVVAPGIDAADDLRGRRVASPQLGSTQDVALRAWLADHGLSSDTAGGGDVSVVPQDNARTLDLLRDGDIAGAWVPEPWARRLVDEGGGHVLVDERDLWPGGRYATTVLVVRAELLERRPDAVRQLLAGHVAATELLATRPGDAVTTVRAAIRAETGKDIPADLVARSFDAITFTNDPLVASLRASADAARALGLLERVDGSDVDDLVDVTLLDGVLAAAHAGARP